MTRTVLLILLIAAAALPARADERDRLIEALTQRVEALERRLAQAPAPSAAPAAERTPARESPPSEDAEGTRALERALVREGGLVLPKGAFEIEAGMSYEHRSFNGLQVFGTQIAQQYVTRDALQASLAARAGLPGAMQVELSVPYDSVTDRRSVPGAGEDRDPRTGLGNVGVGITKQLLDERGAMPSLLGSLYWRDAAKGDPGASPGALASGFQSLQAAVTAVKRADPVVFYGSLSHAWNFARDIGGRDIDPGDTMGVRFGGILAVSPDVSMRLGFDLARSRRTHVNGVAALASDATVAMLETGFGVRLSPGTLLGINAGVGLTSRSPDFRLSFSLPIRF